MHTTFKRPIPSPEMQRLSSNEFIQEHLNSSKQQNKNSGQYFPVNYNGSTFYVDPISLSSSSTKFKELIQPYKHNTEELKTLHLEIYGKQFSNRNIDNFLKLCQKLPTDVRDSEMEEICEIAKLFKANEIYNTGLKFIQSTIDPNFNVPNSKYEGPNSPAYILIEGQKNLMENDSDLSDGYFENTKDNDDKGNYYQINENKNNNSAEIVINSKSAPSDKDKHVRPKRIKTTIIYQIKIEKHGLQCPTFTFYHDNSALFTAKQKNNEIYIAEGSEVHISQKETHIARIIQNTQNLMINTIQMKDTSFNMKYVNSGKKNRYSIEVSFPLVDKMTTWVPRKPRYDPKKEKYTLNFKGEYHHNPVPSAKNILLENKNGKPTFIARKMSNNTYEIECLPSVEPLIAFCLGISDIVGPYCDEETNGEMF